MGYCFFSKYFAKYSLLFWLTFSRSIDFTRISYSIDFTHMWSKYLKSLLKENTQYKHFNNPLFYKLLLFWTVFELQNYFWTFIRVSWSQRPHEILICIQRYYTFLFDTFLWPKDYSVMPERQFNETTVWRKWNFKPAWDFHVNIVYPKRNKWAQARWMLSLMRMCVWNSMRVWIPYRSF